MSLAKTFTVTALCIREAPIEQSVFSTTSFHCRSSQLSPAGAHNLAAVVQRLDSVLQWSNHDLVDTLMNFDNTNPLFNVSNLDSSIEQIEPRVYNSRTAQCFSDQSMTDKYAAIHLLSWAPASSKKYSSASCERIFCLSVLIV